MEKKVINAYSRITIFAIYKILKNKIIILETLMMYEQHSFNFDACLLDSGAACSNPLLYL